MRRRLLPNIDAINMANASSSRTPNSRRLTDRSRLLFEVIYRLLIDFHPGAKQRSALRPVGQAELATSVGRQPMETEFGASIDLPDSGPEVNRQHDDVKCEQPPLPAAKL